MAQKNVELVRRIWEAAEHREDEALFALYDPDIVWQSHYVGPMETGGLYRGHEGIRRFFRDWLESFDAYEARAETFIEVGDQVVVGYRVTGRGKGSGVRVDMPRWNVYRLRNALVTHVEVFDSKDEALASLSSEDSGRS